MLVAYVVEVQSIALLFLPTQALPGLGVAVWPEGAVLVAVAGLALAREGVPPEAGEAAVALPAGGVAQTLWCGMVGISIYPFIFCSCSMRSEIFQPETKVGVEKVSKHRLVLTWRHSPVRWSHQLGA